MFKSIRQVRDHRRNLIHMVLSFPPESISRRLQELREQTERTAQFMHGFAAAEYEAQKQAEKDAAER